MIKSFTIVNFLGDRITMNMREPAQTGFLIKSVEGLGPVKADINTTKIVTGDGSLFNSSRLNERNIVFTFAFVDNDNHETIEDIRQKSYRYFPVKKHIEIIVETDKRTVKTSGYVESNEPIIWGEEAGTQISIVCPDSYFYSLSEVGDHVTDFYSVRPMFEFPFSNESLVDGLIEFGAIQTQSEDVITYRGDADVGIKIFIHANGEASNISIYNTGTREKMEIDTDKIKMITGNGIMPMDDIVINTVKGSKSITLIRNGVEHNILNCLGRNTDWLCLSTGDNTLAFTAEKGMTNLQFRIEHKVVYEGV